MANYAGDMSPEAFAKWIVGIVAATILGFGWMTQNFITTAKGSEMMDKAQAADAKLSQQIANLAVEVRDSNALLLIHMEKGRLDEIIDAIDRKETEMFNVQQFIEVNGTSSERADRLRSLEKEIDGLKLKRDCVINHNPLCD